MTSETIRQLSKAGRGRMAFTGKPPRSGVKALIFRDANDFLHLQNFLKIVEQKDGADNRRKVFYGMWSNRKRIPNNVIPFKF